MSSSFILTALATAINVAFAVTGKGLYWANAGVAAFCFLLAIYLAMRDNRRAK